MDGGIKTLAVSGNTIYVGGDFQNIGRGGGYPYFFASHPYFARFDISKGQPYLQTIDSVILKKGIIVKQTFKKSKAGFFSGLWHGFLFPFRLTASFFMDVDCFADNNAGNYRFGFIIGVIVLLWVMGAFINILEDLKN